MPLADVNRDARVDDRDFSGFTLAYGDGFLHGQAPIGTTANGDVRADVNANGLLEEDTNFAHDPLATGLYWANSDHNLFHGHYLRSRAYNGGSTTGLGFVGDGDLLIDLENGDKFGVKEAFGGLPILSQPDTQYYIAATPGDALTPGWTLVADGENHQPGVNNRLGYAGYWFEPELGLYLVRHRVYDPKHGRWLQRDPIGYAGGLNLYEYVGGMPGKYVDPSGLVSAQIQAATIVASSSNTSDDCRCGPASNQPGGPPSTNPGPARPGGRGDAFDQMGLGGDIGSGMAARNESGQQMGRNVRAFEKGIEKGVGAALSPTAVLGAINDMGQRLNRGENPLGGVAEGIVAMEETLDNWSKLSEEQRSEIGGSIVGGIGAGSLVPGSYLAGGLPLVGKTLKATKHHVATVSHPHWTVQFGELLSSVGTTINEVNSVVRVGGHKGPHPWQYHQAVFDQLREVIGTATGERARLLAKEHLAKIGKECQRKGSPFNLMITKQVHPRDSYPPTPAATHGANP